MSTRTKPRELTGRHVLIWLVSFFVIIFAINGALVRAAITTFGGVETTSSYKAGLQFGRERAAAGQQDALRWQVTGKLTRDVSGEAVLDISARDAQGVALTGLTAVVRLAHPADERLDHVIAVTSAGAGAFRGATEAHAGQWELVIDLYRGEERLFRSQSRVSLR
jgi:nitrogen fixation protein FixH